MSERSQLIYRLTTKTKTREAYIRSKVSTSVASQVRALRRREELTQEGLAEISQMKQSRISAMERPGIRWNVETLVRLAAALRVGLVVRLASFSEMLDWENAFNQDTFNITTIEEDSRFLSGESLPGPTSARPILVGEGSASAVNPIQRGEQDGRPSLLLAQMGAPPLNAAASYAASAQI